LVFENGFKVLPIEAKHLISLFNLKYFHRNPFDRMIIAQSISENIPVISSDGVFKEYPVQVIWFKFILSEPKLPKQKKRPDTEPLPSVCYPYFTELKNFQNKANKCGSF